MNLDAVRHPRLDLVCQQARWRGQDAYPSSVEWADEHERWLELVPATIFRQHYLPRLRDRARHRDKTLAEIGPAFFFQTRCGVPIASWQPPGAAGRTGEYLIGWQPGLVFVEVKSPSWEAEIVADQGKGSPRLLLPKHLDGETRATAPWRYARRAIEKASLQVPGTMPTLVVLNDDLPLPLDFANGFNAKLALYGDGGCFRDGRYPNIGAVGVFQLEWVVGAFEYRFVMFRNPAALPEVRLPRRICRALSGWSESRKRVWGLGAPALRAVIRATL